MKKIAEMGAASVVALGIAGLLFLVWLAGTGDFCKVIGC